MAEKATATMTEIEALYSAFGSTVERWAVVSRTPTGKTFTVAHPTLPSWHKSVRAAQIGVDYHVSAIEALKHGEGRLEKDIAILHRRLQDTRTQLGMVQGERRRRERAAAGDGA